MNRTYSQRLQDQAENKELKYPGRYRYRRKRPEEGFWRRSQVDMVQEIYVTKTQNWYIILHWQNSNKRELNVQAKIKIKNRKELRIEVPVDSECTHTGIDEQLVKNKRIQTWPINFLFRVYNVDRTKNGDIIRQAPLEVKINKHKEHLEVAVTDLNETDMFLGYNWLVKHNSEVN